MLDIDDLRDQLSLEDRKLARRLLVWVVWSPDVTRIAAYQRPRLAESHMMLEARVEHAEEAQAKGFFAQEWNLVEALRRGLLDLDRAVGYVLMEKAEIAGGRAAPRTEPTEEEKVYARGIETWEVWYEDRFSHEGHMVEVHLTREEATAHFERLGGAVDMESGKFDGFEVNRSCLAERLRFSVIPGSRFRALVLRHRAEQELEARRGAALELEARRGAALVRDP
ncbi:MAG: hypothetical protein JRI25_09275 [Deltaproteobacteria bacterium]|nr:hypothetical protein [Deltaproteobacteria bacterium]